jgi:hypothetical protein
MRIELLLVSGPLQGWMSYHRSLYCKIIDFGIEFKGHIFDSLGKGLRFFWEKFWKWLINRKCSLTLWTLASLGHELPPPCAPSRNSKSSDENPWPFEWMYVGLGKFTLESGLILKKYTLNHFPVIFHQNLMHRRERNNEHPIWRPFLSKIQWKSSDFHPKLTTYKSQITLKTCDWFRPAVPKCTAMQSISRRRYWKHVHIMTIFSTFGISPYDVMPAKPGIRVQGVKSFPMNGHVSRSRLS